MLVGIIITPREEILKNPERFKEAALKISETIKQLPSEVKVKARYVFGAGDNGKAIMIFDVSDYSALGPLGFPLPEYFHVEAYPVVDNTGEVVQQFAR